MPINFGTGYLSFMDLKLFFDPIDLEIDNSSSSFHSSIYVNRHKMPDHEGLDIALIGLNEFRGANKNPKLHAANEVRHQLYQLKKGYGEYGIIDLGNFRNGPTLEDTYLRLKEVCSYLIGKEIIPVLFGGSQDIVLGQYYAFEDADKLISLLNVDNKIDYAGETNAESYLPKILKHTPNYLFNYYHLGYQSYLADQKYLELFSRLSFEAHRLGSIKENIKEMEPIVRDADVMSIDVSAIQASYVPGAFDSKVYGLTGEEGCQLTWYAGQNEKLSSIGIFNYNPDKDAEDKKTAFVISTLIWYFVEGYYHRKGDKNFRSNDYLMYEVHLGGEPETIRFYKSKLSERWWMEVPSDKDEGLFNRNRMLACSYSDYETATNGTVPDRWLNFFYKD